MDRRLDSRHALADDADRDDAWWLAFGCLLALLAVGVVVACLTLTLRLRTWSDDALAATDCRTSAALVAASTGTAPGADDCGSLVLPDLLDLLTGQHDD